MRRTFALLGAAALAITGLAGPAHASDINTDEPVIFGAIQPDTTSPDNDQAWFDLKNLDPDNVFLLEDYSVVGCVGTTSTTSIAFITYQLGDIIDPNALFKTADPGFDGPEDVNWTAQSGVLDSLDLDLRLVFDLGGPAEHLEDIVSTGMPNGTCVASLPS